MKKVILIEDDPSIVDVYSEAFKLAKIDLDAITWGKDAIQRIQDIQAGKAEKPALFLIDLLLPDINGAEILKTAKTTEATKDIPAFILSNYTSQNFQSVDNIQPDKFIVKSDITPTKLMEIVKEVIK
jgi:CheY-like chemotaxis protein